MSDKGWRYIHYANGEEELYDSRADRYEWTNLATKSEHALKLAELRKKGPRSFAPLVRAKDESLSRLKWRPASDGAAPASKPDGNTFDVVFINPGKSAVKLFWMNRQGKPMAYGAIAGGKRKRQQTRPGAVWLITDLDEKPLGHFRVRDRTAQAVVPASD